MSIGDVFAKAWELWRRDIGWLILAGLVVGLIVGVVAVIVFSIVFGMLAVSVGGIALNSSGDVNSITGLSVGTVIAAVILGIVGYLIVSVLAMVFYGGMFEMVLGAARENRGVNFGDLFSGFRKFGSFIVLWLVIAGISIACGIVAIIPIIGIIAVLVFGAWLGTTWLYVLPADRRPRPHVRRGDAHEQPDGQGCGLVEDLRYGHRARRRLLRDHAGHLADRSGLVVAQLHPAADLRDRRRPLRDLLHQHDVPRLRRRSGPRAGRDRRYGMPAPPASGGLRPTALRRAPPAGGQAYQPTAPPPIAAPPVGRLPACHDGRNGRHGRHPAGADAWKAAADPLAGQPPLPPPPPRRRTPAPQPSHGDHDACDGRRRRSAGPDRPAP